MSPLYKERVIELDPVPDPNDPYTSYGKYDLLERIRVPDNKDFILLAHEGRTVIYLKFLARSKVVEFDLEKSEIITTGIKCLYLPLRDGKSVSLEDLKEKGIRKISVGVEDFETVLGIWDSGRGPGSQYVNLVFYEENQKNIRQNKQKG